MSKQRRYPSTQARRVSIGVRRRRSTSVPRLMLLPYAKYQIVMRARNMPRPAWRRKGLAAFPERLERALELRHPAFGMQGIDPDRHVVRRVRDDHLGHAAG